MGRVSRNGVMFDRDALGVVTPRMGRVSRNAYFAKYLNDKGGHAPHGACE